MWVSTQPLDLLPSCAACFRDMPRDGARRVGDGKLKLGRTSIEPFRPRVDFAGPRALRAPDAHRHIDLIPLGRAATAEEIAGAIVFLASGWASFITGEILNVNGGAVLCG